MLVRRVGGGVSEKGERGPEKPGPGGPGPGGPDSGAGPREVRSLEEQVLERLVAGEEPLPPPEEMPPAEAFLDTECRNIYRAFCALYARMGSRPDVRALTTALGHEGDPVARLAMILVERNTGSERIGPPGPSLEKLMRRWQKQRLQELATEIGEAQRLGDQARLEHLLKEKTSLSHSLHRGTRPSASGGAL
jgi:hypothetical protein